MECEICGNNEWETIYDGPVRDGKDNHVASVVRKCANCLVWRLDDSQSFENYVDGTYREKLNQPETVEYFQSRHDDEQIHKLLAIAKRKGVGWLRNRDILDVGAGAGSFLSFVSGVADRMAAIEPLKSYHSYLDLRFAFMVWSSLDDMLLDNVSPFDFVTCFDTLEHVQEPVKLIKQMKELAGVMLLSVPDRAEAHGHKDLKNYFCTQHKWYWNVESFKRMLEIVGIDIDQIYSEPEEIGPQIYAWC